MKPPLPAPYVQFQHVDKSYDGATMVVRDLELDVYEGEFLTLLGPSGSGKTTCLMMLAGFEAPTAGTIHIAGRAVADLPPRKRDIGMVFQNYALFPHMTVGGNLAFPLQVRGLAKGTTAQRVQRALELVRLEGFEDRRPGQLSGGQQQRVAIARALVFEPELVLMDEPLGALDRRLREEMQFEIRRIQRSLGVTVVYVTHDQQEAMAMSDRVAVFHRGRIEQVAPPEVLYEEPQRPFVAAFIGDNNLLPGRVVGVDGDICVVDIDGAPPPRKPSPSGTAFRPGPSTPSDFVADAAKSDGLRVQAFRVAPVGIGDAVVLAIRPERVALAPEAGRYTNETTIRVQDIAFLGDHLRVQTEICGKDFVVKIPNIVGHGAVLPGDDVRIGWTPTDCRALAPRKPSPSGAASRPSPSRPITSSDLAANAAKSDELLAPEDQEG